MSEDSPERGEPTVWVRALRFCRHRGRPVSEGEPFLIYEDEVENIVTVLKFAALEPPVPQLTRNKP